jgi:TonB family protein
MLALLLTSLFYVQAQSSPAPVPPGTMRSDGAYLVGNGVSAPVLMHRTICEMPDLARKLRAQGNVTLSLVVTADGAVRDVRIVKSAGYGMDQQAAECIAKWRFQPGRKDGSPVDVAVQTGYDFGLSPRARLWGAGPLVFAPGSQIHPPVLKSGAMPTSECEPGDETVLLQFTVDPSGDVRDIQPLHGQASTSLPLLSKSIATWKFTPASNETGPIAATGKVLLIKGEDPFRYRAYTSFRDSGSPQPPEPKPIESPATPGSIKTMTLHTKVNLEPDEAGKQLVHTVAPEYPAEAKAAHIQGTVSLVVTIDKDGSVKEVKEISGPRELVPAAIRAVRQWRYNPIFFRGQAQEAETVVDVPFKLPE